MVWLVVKDKINNYSLMQANHLLNNWGSKFIVILILLALVIYVPTILFLVNWKAKIYVGNLNKKTNEGW